MIYRTSGALSSGRVREALTVVPLLDTTHYDAPTEVGVQIEFHTCGYDFEAEITADGSLRSVWLAPVENNK